MNAGEESSSRGSREMQEPLFPQPTLQIENPAGANFKAHVGNNELWYTWHGATDAEVVGRMRETLPLLQEIVEACEQQRQPAASAKSAPSPALAGDTTIRAVGTSPLRSAYPRPELEGEMVATRQERNTHGCETL